MVLTLVFHSPTGSLGDMLEWVTFLNLFNCKWFTLTLSTFVNYYYNQVYIYSLWKDKSVKLFSKLTLIYFIQCAKLSMEDLTLTRYILEMSLMDYELLDSSDSALAAAALLLTRIIRGDSTWTPTLQYYSGEWQILYNQLARRYEYSKTLFGNMLLAHMLFTFKCYVIMDASLFQLK